MVLALLLNTWSEHDNYKSARETTRETSLWHKRVKMDNNTYTYLVIAFCFGLMLAILKFMV